MRLKRLLLTLPLLLLPVAPGRAAGSGVAPADLKKPLAETWPTYSGDYSGKRYSALTQINQETVKRLGLAWVAKLTAGPGAPGRRFGRGGGARDHRRRRAGRLSGRWPPTMKGTPLMVNGTLYVTTPDNTWALDARDGRELLALLLAHEGQHADRQSRRRHLERLPVLRDARQLLRLARREDGQGALEQGPRRLQPAVLLDDGADRRRQPRAARHRQRPRLAGLHPVVRS